jgi:hypothetical protein
MYLEPDGYPEVKEGDIVYTMECRPCYDPGMCGEGVTQKTRYKIVTHNEHLMAECLDYERIKEIKDLRSIGLAWVKEGYKLCEPPVPNKSPLLVL